MFIPIISISLLICLKFKSFLRLRPLEHSLNIGLFGHVATGIPPAFHF